MKLPLLISVPHAGLSIPPEVESINALTIEEIIRDGDEGASEVYCLETVVEEYLNSHIARAFVDLNRAPDDFSKDGVIKTHTVWNIPVYIEQPDEVLRKELLDSYYFPYHSELTGTAETRKDILVAIDCHTMVDYGPPVGPDPGMKRPFICLSNGDGTCPDEWIQSLAKCFQYEFGSGEVKINDPFKGGYIAKTHASEMPWLQLEVSRSKSITNQEKREKVIRSLGRWCSNYRA